MARPSRTRRAADYSKQLRKRLTAAEVALWQKLRRNQLGTRFRRQEAIGKYIADFVTHEHRLVVELDGAYHEFDGPDRTLLLNRLGYRVLRFENDLVGNAMDVVLETIREALAGTLEAERYDQRSG